jgi:hypothetical protein
MSAPDLAITYWFFVRESERISAEIGALNGGPGIVTSWSIAANLGESAV